MITKQAAVYFENENEPIHLELWWIDRADYLEKIFIEKFSLKETSELSVFVTMRGETDLGSLLDYIGHDITEARTKHKSLNTCFVFSEKFNNPHAYGIDKTYGIGALQVFFIRIARGDEVTKIELSAIEEA